MLNDAWSLIEFNSGSLCLWVGECLGNDGCLVMIDHPVVFYGSSGKCFVCKSIASWKSHFPSLCLITTEGVNRRPCLIMVLILMLVALNCYFLHKLLVVSSGSSFTALLLYYIILIVYHLTTGLTMLLLSISYIMNSYAHQLSSVTSYTYHAMVAEHAEGLLIVDTSTLSKDSPKSLKLTTTHSNQTKTAQDVFYCFVWVGVISNHPANVLGVPSDRGNQIHCW